MSPNLLDKRITLQRLAQSTVSGNVVDSWETITDRWSRIEWTQSTEDVDLGQKTNTRTAVFTVRHDPETETLTERDRISHNGQSFSITAILDLPGGRPVERKITAQTCPV